MTGRGVAQAAPERSLDAEIEAWIQAINNQQDRNIVMWMERALRAENKLAAVGAPQPDGPAYAPIDLDADMKGHGSYRDALIEECAMIADAVDSGRGNEKEIAKAIRALALPSTEGKCPHGNENWRRCHLCNSD